MPFNIEPLDASASEENITILLGRNILLKILEDPAAEALLEDSLVEKLVSVQNLCSEKNVNLIQSVLKTDVYQELSKSDDWLGKLYDFEDIDQFESSIERLRKERRLSWEAAEKKVGLRWLQSRERKLVKLEAEIKKEMGLEVLEPEVLIVCPRCENLAGIGEFKGALKCEECRKVIVRDKARRMHVHCVAEPIRTVWKSGLWFEAYFARLLRRLDWKTWVKVHIMGASGVSHEIDILAIKGGNIFVAECKSGKVSRNDVFNFLTKTQDLKVNMGLLVLLGKLPEPDTEEFVAKNRQLSMIDSIMGLKESQILEKLRQELPA